MDLKSLYKNDKTVLQLMTSFFWDVTQHQWVIEFQHSLIKSRPNYPVSQHYIPEKQNAQLHHFKNLKTSGE
jgi:hypothetical protein